jgi:hypothetical protein
MNIAAKIHDYLEFNLVGRTPSASEEAARFGLTSRELDVIELVCCGRTNRKISECLGIGRDGSDSEKLAVRIMGPLCLEQLTEEETLEEVCVGSEPNLPPSALLTCLGQRAVRVRERDPAVDIDGPAIHLALPLGEKAQIVPKFSSRPISPCGRTRCRRSG